MIEISVIIAACCVCTLSLVGAVTLKVPESKLARVVPLLVSLAAGVLLADVFLHILPDAQKVLPVEKIGEIMLYSILGFFFIEKIIRHRPQNLRHLGKMNLVADGLHNFIDGVLIAGSFSVDWHTGLVTTIGILVHELPQELGDVGVLIYSGYTPRRAVALNFLCSLSCLAGAIFALLVGSWMHNSLAYLLPVAGGAFLYIAVADFLPNLHQPARKLDHLAQVAVMLLGVLSLILVGVIEKVV